ncbi:MAG: Gldg family protein [Mobilitalea sp.]
MALKKLEKKDKKKIDMIGKMKASFSGRKFRSGAYASAVSAVVVVIILVVNLLFSQLNITFDLSSQEMYTLTDETTGMVKNLEDDITIYYMVETGSEDKVFQEITEKYDNLSDKLTVVTKDPVLYPKFAARYVTDEVEAGGFIVVNEANQRAKYVSGNDMLVQELNSQTYSYETTGIDAEGQLTAAIQYVSSADLPKMYVVEGHGETAVDESFNEAVEKMNITVEALATKTAESIPEDCDILYINGPQSDLLESETTMIKDYLVAGGNALISVDYLADDLTNFDALLQYYGVEVVDGVVVEGDSSRHYTNYPYYVIPGMESHEVTADTVENGVPLMMPLCSGLISSSTTRSSLTVTPILTSSDSAYSKISESSTTYEKEEGDIEGPFNLGVVATDTYNDTISNVIVYSTDTLFTADVMTYYGNATLLNSTMNYLSGDMEALSIPTKSIESSMIVLTQQQALSWGAAVVVVIPVALLLMGVLVTLRRRKK